MLYLLALKVSIASPSINASENTGSVTVCVALTADVRLEDDFSVDVHTREHSATGTANIMQAYFQNYSLIIELLACMLLDA